MELNANLDMPANTIGIVFGSVSLIMIGVMLVLLFVVSGLHFYNRKPHATAIRKATVPFLGFLEIGAEHPRRRHQTDD